jgi:hypothetical protein
MSKKETKSVEKVVRVVTEADIKSDPRLLDAGVVVGQLYDFSNLAVLPESASFREEEVNDVNEVKADIAKATEDADKALEDTDAVTAAEKVALRERRVANAARLAVKEETSK